MKLSSSLIPALLLCAAPAFADVSVNSPAAGAAVSSPFQLAASSTVCSSQTVAAMGYSLDASTNTTIVQASAVNAQVVATPGSHTLHVKSWGKGTSCVLDVPITIVSSTASVTTAAASIEITAPEAGADVQPTFTLSANSVSCSGRQVVTMGYSIDASTNTTVVNGELLNAQVTAPAGSHTVHVKSWSPNGGACVVDLAVTVAGPQSNISTPLPGPVVPANATKVSSVQSLSNWLGVNDTGTIGSSTGSMSVVNSPSMSGFARKFTTSFVNNGGQRYSDAFGEDTAASNFLFDGWVYLQGPSNAIANVEMDMNQTIANGNTIIYAFQCDGWSGTWDYSVNAGTISSPVIKWVNAKGTTCNPRNWTANAWHHVQISYSRDNSGNVTFQSVWIDGVGQTINATVLGEFQLGWAPVLLTNFQVDGVGASGTATAYLDNLTVYRW